jgi:hypothetical protein
LRSGAPAPPTPALAVKHNGGKALALAGVPLPVDGAGYYVDPADGVTRVKVDSRFIPGDVVGTPILYNSRIRPSDTGYPLVAVVGTPANARLAGFNSISQTSGVNIPLGGNECFLLADTGVAGGNDSLFDNTIAGNPRLTIGLNATGKPACNLSGANLALTTSMVARSIIGGGYHASTATKTVAMWTAAGTLTERATVAQIATLNVTGRIGSIPYFSGYLWAAVVHSIVWSDTAGLGAVAQDEIALLVGSGASMDDIQARTDVKLASHGLICGAYLTRLPGSLLTLTGTGAAPTVEQP